MHCTTNAKVLKTRQSLTNN